MKGACYCGACKWYLSPDINDSSVFWSGFCHCSDCRLASSSLVYQAVYFGSSLVSLEGDTRCWSRDVSKLRRCFCATCGTRVWNEVVRNGRENDIGLFPALCENPKEMLERFPATSHVFCKEAFVELPQDGLERFNGWPDSQQLEQLRKRT